MTEAEYLAWCMRRYLADAKKAELEAAAQAEARIDVAMSVIEGEPRQTSGAVHLCLPASETLH